MDAMNAAFDPEAHKSIANKSETATNVTKADAGDDKVVHPDVPNWHRVKVGHVGIPLPTGAGLRGFGVRWRRPLTALGVLVFGVVGTVTLVATKPDLPKAQKPERIWTVDASEALRADHRPDIKLMGTVQPGRTLTLRSLVAGTVVETSPALKEGGLIRAGEPLLTIEAIDYELALAERRAQLDEARARLDELRANVQVRGRDAERARELFKRGTIAAPRFEESENALVAEKARVRAQEAVIARLQAAIQSAELDLSRTRLVAPFDSFVGEVAAESGMRLSNLDKVAELVGAENMEARISLPTAAYGRLVQDGESLVGRSAEAVWHLGDRTITYPATVVRVSDRIDTAAGGVGIFVRLEGNHLQSPIRPGAFVEVRVPDRLYTNVVRLPPTALHGDNTVYVINADGRLAARKVEVVATKSDAVFLGSGLEPGEKVVTTRFQEIGPGVKVTLRGATDDAAKATEANKATDTSKQEGGQ